MKAHIRIRAAVLITSLIAGAANAAVPGITISDGVTSVGPIPLSGGAAIYSTNTFDASWASIGIVAESKPLVGSATSPALLLSITAVSLGSANPLSITLSDNDFGPTSGSNNVVAFFNGHPANGSGSAVTFNTYYDTNNTVDALTTLLTTSGSILPDGANDYASTESNSLSAAGPFSLTEVFTISGTTAATYSLGGTITVSNQPCVCTLNFNCPSNVMICESDPVPDPVAEAASISATDTCLGKVAVSFLGATTNGACPSPEVITYNFGATSGCGQLMTCQQTVTINCLPACDVTTVSNTIVGTSNLTASVQNAGTGASYSWSINNGTITSAETNSSITYTTAGSDDTKVVKVCVTVTSAAGCESTCCAEVPLIPQPNTNNFGHGDAATIGFWHNKNGQAVINSAAGKTNLSFWLSSNFPCLLGGLQGDTDAQVAAAYLTAFSKPGGLVANDTVQIFAVALACYFTSTDLGGNSTAAGKGFNQTPGGTGSLLYNVGSNGAAFGVPDNSEISILTLLQDANALCPLSGQSTAILQDLNNVFNGINQGGDISN